VLYAAFALGWIHAADSVLSHVTERQIALHLAVAGTFFAGAYLRQRERLHAALREATQARALERAEQRFEATFEHAAIGLCHVDATGRLLRANALCIRLLGHAGGPLPALADVLVLDSAQHQSLLAALKGGQPFSCDLRARRGDQLRGWFRVSVSAMPAQADASALASAVVVLDDISARKLAAQALQRSEEQLRSYAEHAPLGVVLVDARGRLLQANAAALALAGRTPHQSWLKPLADLVSERGRPLSRWASRPLLRTGRWSLEAQLQRADGSTRWIAVNAARAAGGHYLAFVQDITERKQEERALRQAHALFESTQEGLLVTDPDANIVAANPAFCRTTGYTLEELRGRPVHMLSSGRQDAAFYHRMWATLAQTGMWQGEVWNRRKNGEVYPQWLAINAVRGPDGTLMNYVAAGMDLTRARQSEMELQRMAHHDALTGLPNRLLLMETLEQAVARAQRQRNRGAVLMLDLDRFKNVNDSLGHPAGDRLLQEMAQRLRARLRSADTIARLGGDEFGVLVEGLADPEDAAKVAHALIHACQQPVTLDGGLVICMGASVGISLFPDDSAHGDRLIQQADAAMYSAKGAGRGTFRFFTGAFTEEAQSRLDLEAGLRQALEQQFSVHYQPLVSAADGRVEGVEALVRWMHPQRGLVSPAEFIPLAEDTGLIVPLGDWVLRTACAQMKQWQAQGIAPRTLAVNLSPRQFAQGDLAQQVERVLAETGLPAQALELEITESALMDAAQAGARLRRLKALGVRLAIDDFGTGYSSLAYLSRFPIDKLKVDQGFVRRMPTDSTDREIAAAVISLAKNLKLCVLAEGVETREQLAFLRERGCDLVQGYLFSKPLPEPQVTALLASGRRFV
jgi:diguanylate cyclase (GGDEF)-like protein/PAS domain S-box-containing protein